MGHPFERRNNDRLKIRGIFIKYKYPQSDEVYSVELINISAGGFCFIRDALIYKNDQIEVLFKFESKKVKLLSQIVRIDGREVAAKFIDKQEKIEEFVEYFNIEYPTMKKVAELYELTKDDLFNHRKEEKEKKEKNKKMFDI